MESLIDGQLLVLKRINLAINKNENEMMSEATLLTILPPHPNVVGIKRWFIEASALVLVLEACDGDLSTLPISNEDGSIDIAEQVTKGLAHIHAHGIIHRDIKPRNLLYNHLNGKIVVKIADFGIAKKLGAGIDFAETAIGTPYYLSPEVCTGAPYDYKTDMWALGCVLFELASNGQKPFSGNSIKELISAIQHNQVPKLGKPNLDHLIALLLQKDPHKRPSSQTFLEVLVQSKCTFESEYHELCALIGQERLDNFLHLANKHNTCSDSFEKQLEGVVVEVSTSHVLTRLLALRKQALCSETHLDAILNIMRTFPRTEWEPHLIDELGRELHEKFLNQQKVYSLCYELYLLERQVFQN